MNLIFVWVAALLLPGIAVASDENETPVVIATTSIWADIVDRLDCTDTFSIETLIPVGADAHSFEPSVRDRARLSDAALVVANGGRLEAVLHDTLESVADDGVPVFEVVDHVTTAPSEPGADGHDGDGENEGGDDPHVWFDPTLVVEAIPYLGEALVAAGADEADVADCVAELTAELEALDAEIVEILAAVPDDRRKLVTNHDALGYFARRYGFEVLGTVLPGSSTLAQASPAEFAELSEAIDTAGVDAIFAEALESADEATALADRVGVDVVTLFTDSLGADGSGAESYPDLMRFNATAIAAALGQ